MKVWITKYALSEGIIEAEAKTTEFPDMVTVPSMGLHACFHGEGRDWHCSRECAEIRADEMRKAKIKSIQKQLRKLEAMDFGVTMLREGRG